MTHTPGTGPLLYEGKAKRVYATDQDDLVAVEYKDDATAFNALKKAQLLGKGALNCRISALLFEHLERLGVPTHYLGLQGDHWMMVRPVRVVPVEVVVRNVAAGSLCRQMPIPAGTPWSRRFSTCTTRTTPWGTPCSAKRGWSGSRW